MRRLFMTAMLFCLFLLICFPVSRADKVLIYMDLGQSDHLKAYGVAYSVLRNEEEARDVVQDSLIKVHRNLPRFRGESGFYTWLYRIVYNRALDIVRKPGRRAAECLAPQRLPQPGSNDLDV